MAVAVIGGLITSTVLSLLVIPSVFTVMDDFEHWMGKVKRWARRGKVKEDGQTNQAVPASGRS